MKLSCDIIEDLLPLYFDEVCSKDSRVAVEEHVRNCPKCRANITRNEPMHIPQISPKEEERSLKRSLRRIKQRWWLSILAAIMLVPLFLLGVMVRNEIHKEGVCYSNIRELRQCYGFLRALQNKNEEKAASYLDFEPYYEECREALEMTPQDHLAPYIEIDIHGECWMIQENWYDSYFKDINTDTNLWKTLLKKSPATLMIPLEEFEKIAMEDNGIPMQGNGYRMSDGTCYFPYEKDSETYMIHETTFDMLRENGMFLTDGVTMLPKKLYQELHPALWERAEQWCLTTQSRLSEIADLDREGFCSYMQDRYKRKLDTFFEQGFSITDFSYSTIYNSGNGWEGMFFVSLDGEGNRYSIRLMSSATGGITHLYMYDRDGIEIPVVSNLLSPKF